MQKTLPSDFYKCYEVNKGGCWIWKKTIARPQGYGKFGSSYAHRWSYEQFIGEIPKGYTIDHLCRNRLCVNPSHLEAVSQKENVLRGNAPTAISFRTNKCIRGHEFTPENTYIRPDTGRRACKTCRKDRYVKKYNPAFCKRGHPFLPETTYTNPNTGWKHCKICASAKRKLNCKKHCTCQTAIHPLDLPLAQVWQEAVKDEETSK